MDWDDFKSLVVFIIFCAVVITLILAPLFYLDSLSCNAKTKDMGFNHAYSILGGCKIEVKPGQWIPLDSYYFRQQ